MCIAEGFLETLQCLLKDAEAQEGIAHTEAHLAIQLQAHSGALHVQASLAVRDGFLEFTEFLIAPSQVQVALHKVVRVL